MRSTENATSFTAIGPIESVAEVGEQLAWLGAAIRDAPEDSGVASCFPFIRQIEYETISNDNTITVCHIDFEISRFEGKSTTSGSGRCWHGLFQNPVVVEGYPILRKPIEKLGMEMSPLMMAALIGNPRVSLFSGTTFIKTFCAMIFAVKMVEDIVIWHFLLNDTGEHISYDDYRVKAILESQTSKVCIDSLGSTRHIVGWCSKITNLTGQNREERLERVLT